MADVYASFNSFTVTGRVSFAEIVEHKGSTWLAVTMITEFVDDGKAYTITFNTTNGLLTMFRNGNLTGGRRLTVTGHIAEISEIYFDKKLGKSRPRKRPLIHLTKAQVFDGGVGPAKREDLPAVAPVDNVVEFDAVDFEDNPVAI